MGGSELTIHLLYLSGVRRAIPGRVPEYFLLEGITGLIPGRAVRAPVVRFSRKHRGRK